MSPANAAVSPPTPQVPPAPATNTVQISQVSTQGPAGALDEFVELHNVQMAPLDISGYTVWSCPAAGPQVLLATIPAGTVLQGSVSDPTLDVGSYYLIANQNYSRFTAPDLSYAIGDIQRLGGVLLRGAPTATSPQGLRVDSVGFSVGNSCTETAPAQPQSPAFVDQASLRVSNQDSNVNAVDFALISPAFPRNSSF
jgi:hypothetical protein